MHTTTNPIPVRIAALLLAVAPACGFAESNALDLPPIEGSPVVLKNVRMAESRYAALGSTPTRFSSSDAANAIGLAYDVHVVGPASSYSGVTAQLACRVGEHTVVSVLATDASDRLSAAEPGAVFEHRDTFPPTQFSDAIPTVCEATAYYTIAPPLAAPSPGDPPAPGPELRPIGTVCFSDGKLSEGACAPETLPRTPAATKVAASLLVGRIGAIQGSTGYGVGITVLVTAGDGVPDTFHIGGDATCELDGETYDIPLGLMMSGRRLRPGESIVHSGATPATRALPRQPQWCTVHVQHADQGTKRLLADFCVRGESTSEGACSPE